MLMKQGIIIVFISAILVITTAGQLFTSSRNQTCGTTDDCKENSYCYTSVNKCKCNEGYKMDRNRTSYQCLAVIKLEEPCETDQMCQLLDELAICDESKRCACGSGSYNNNGTCYLIVKLGDICMNDQNCRINDGTSIGRCENGRCECPDGQKPAKENTICVTPRKIGDGCTYTEECTLTDNSTICKEKCVCGNEYALSRNETECLKAANQFGDSCSENGQCSKNLKESVCNQGICGCMSDFYIVENQCMERNPNGVNIGDPCEEDAQCTNEMHPEMSIKCLDGACTYLAIKTTFNKEGNENNSAMKLTTVMFYNVSFILFITLLKM